MNREAVDKGKPLVVEGFYNYYFGLCAVILFG